jgi:transglutaminase-like putative cysteine protease
MKRRDFLQTAFALVTPSDLSAASPKWRTFEVTTRVEVLKSSGMTRIWVPLALMGPSPFQKTLVNTFTCEGGSAQKIENKRDGLGMVAAEFPDGVKPFLTVTSRVSTRNWIVDLSAPSHPRSPKSELDYFLRPTQVVPTDGIVKQRAEAITKGARTDIAKARVIYEWIVENTYRNPKTRGCGLGDIRYMLESGDLGGKCADLNALYVGLARAVGLPARDVYGIRVGKSELGYKSLGPSTASITKAQHCRAEVYLSDFGWVPVDPADVRKVMLEEAPGNRPLGDEMVSTARTRLFGSWEMNWLAYNFAQDVALPGSSGAPVHFLMYPHAETSLGRVDSLDPDSFCYQITAREITAITKV